MTFFLMFFALSFSNSHFYTALIIRVGTCDECVPVLLTSPSQSLFSQFLSTLGITFLTCLHIYQLAYFSKHPIWILSCEVF
jgi:hypothetical protein